MKFIASRSSVSARSSTILTSFILLRRFKSQWKSLRSSLQRTWSHQETQSKFVQKSWRSVTLTILVFENAITRPVPGHLYSLVLENISPIIKTSSYSPIEVSKKSCCLFFKTHLHQNEDRSLLSSYSPIEVSKKSCCLFFKATSTPKWRQESSKSFIIALKVSENCCFLLFNLIGVIKRLSCSACRKVEDKWHWQFVHLI